MEEDAVRKMLQNGVGLSDAVCSSLLHLFHLHDAPNERKINKSEFEMVLAMLTHQCDTVEDQIDVCFTMFDTDGNGHLSREDFERMLQVLLQRREPRGKGRGCLAELTSIHGLPPRFTWPRAAPPRA